MGLKNIFTSKKAVFDEDDQLRLTNAIAKAEIATSGEIRIFIEGHCAAEDPLIRASEVFDLLEMEKTRLRNGVLIYLAIHDRKVALFGDEGIYQKTGGPEYWESELKMLIQHFAQGALVEGLEQVIHDIGFSLSEHFPYEPGTDKNELPDEIVFGDNLRMID